MAERAPHLLLVPAFLGGHGGLENHVLSFARVAAGAGYRVSVVTPRPIPAGGDLTPRLASVATVDDAERHWRASIGGRAARLAAGARTIAVERRPLPAARRASLALDRARPYLDRYWQGPGAALVRDADVVHAFGKPKAFVRGVVVAAADAGTPVVYNEIAQVTPAYAHRSDLAPFARVVDRCDHVVTISESQEADLRARFGYTGPVTVVEQWADGLEDDLLAIDRPQRPSGAPVVVGSLSRLSPEKGLETLLDAVARTGDRVRLRIAGTGGLDGELRARVARLGLGGRVELVGYVEDRAAFYRDLDVFVVASIEEGGPITGAEAMAAGLPVVTTPCGAMADRVRGGHEGLRFAAGDAEALATALDRLAADPALGRSLGEAARARYLARNAAHENTARLLGLWSNLRGRAPSEVGA